MPRLFAVSSGTGANRSFEEYVAARWGAHYRTAYLLTRHAEEAEDLAQSALARAYQHWAKISRVDSPDAYVKRTLVNEFLSRQRRLKVARGSRVQAALLDATPGHLGLAEQTTERLALWELVCALPPKQRAVVVLRYYEDYSEQQIAETLGCSRGTVKSQAHAALKALQGQLADPNSPSPRSALEGQTP